MGLAAISTYDSRNKQEANKVQQNVARVSHIEFANLLNKILLVCRLNPTCLSQTLMS